MYGTTLRCGLASSGCMILRWSKIRESPAVSYGTLILLWIKPGRGSGRSEEWKGRVGEALVGHPGER